MRFALNPRPSRLKVLLRDGAIVAGMTIALVLFAETFLRVFFPQHLVVKYLSEKPFMTVDSILGARYVPGATVTIRHPEYKVEYAINQDGFRDRTPHPVPKPPGTTRVLLLGDSFTFGMGLNYDETWPAILEKRLAASGWSHISIWSRPESWVPTRVQSSF